MGEQLVIQANGERTLRNKVGFVMVESYQISYGIARAFHPSWKRTRVVACS